MSVWQEMLSPFVYEKEAMPVPWIHVEAMKIKPTLGGDQNRNNHQELKRESRQMLEIMFHELLRSCFTTGYF